MDSQFFAQFPLMSIFFLLLEIFKKNVYDVFEYFMNAAPFGSLLNKIMSTACIGILFFICLAMLLCCMMVLLFSKGCLQFVISLQEIRAASTR